MNQSNTQIRMRRRPRGEVSVNDFEMVQTPLAALTDGEVLVRNEWLSLDPYMRLRMIAQRSYVPPLEPGDVMPGGTVGTVAASRDPVLPIGTKVVGRLRWETHSRTTSSALQQITHTDIPVSTALGVVGMPGVTAHYGLLELAQPQRGETVVVSAATGAVGSVVGQLAKAAGCHVVGIAGGPEKCRYATETLGFDDCIDYRADDFTRQLTKATPDRVDIQFENVGGRVMDAVLERLNDYARITVCGLISEYDENHRWPLTNTLQLLVNRVRLQGFIISEHPEYWPGALTDLAERVRQSQLIYSEDITQGLSNAPAAFIRMLKGGNFGKTLVHVADANS